MLANKPVKEPWGLRPGSKAVDDGKKIRKLNSSLSDKAAIEKNPTTHLKENAFVHQVGALLKLTALTCGTLVRDDVVVVALAAFQLLGQSTRRESDSIWRDSASFCVCVTSSLVSSTLSGEKK